MKGQMMNWEDYLDANQSQFVDDLLEFVRIPSVSASENLCQGCRHSRKLGCSKAYCCWRRKRLDDGN